MPRGGIVNIRKSQGKKKRVSRKTAKNGRENTGKLLKN